MKKLFTLLLALTCIRSPLVAMRGDISTRLNQVSNAVKTLSNTIYGKKPPVIPPPITPAKPSTSTQPSKTSPLQKVNLTGGAQINIMDPNNIIQVWAKGNLPPSTPPKKTGGRHPDRASRGFFSYVTGMNENEFRKLINWPDATPDPNLKKVTGDVNKLDNNWILQYENPVDSGNFPRAALLASRNYYITDSITEGSKIKTSPSGSSSRFTIIYHDDQKQFLTEIQCLQAQPNNKNAVFQIASTFFGPLEGGMILAQNSLEEMVTSAVQGEFSSMSAAGATIFTKYIMPIEAPSTQGPWPREGKNNSSRAPYFNQYYYLLQKAGTFIDKSTGRQITGVPVYINEDTMSPALDFNFISQNNPTQFDPLLVNVLVKKNVIITWGGTEIKGQEIYLPVFYNSTNQTIDPNKSQVVSQIFCSAINFGTPRAKQKLSSVEAINWAQAVLEGSYRATILAAYNLGAKKLYLTMLGGGAFNNKLEWIIQSLKKLIPTIKNLGLDIYFIYRDDYRIPGQERAFFQRDTNYDFYFLQDLHKIKQEINEKNNKQTMYETNKNTLWEYLNKAYKDTDYGEKSTYYVSQM